MSAEYRNDKDNDLCHGCKFAVEMKNRSPWSRWYTCTNGKRIDDCVLSAKRYTEMGAYRAAISELLRADDMRFGLTHGGCFAPEEGLFCPYKAEKEAK